MDVHPPKHGINRYWSIPIYIYIYTLYWTSGIYRSTYNPGLGTTCTTCTTVSWDPTLSARRKAVWTLTLNVPCFFLVSLCWKILNYIYIIQYTYLLLVGGKTTTSLKNMSSSVGVIFPNIWKNKTCSKPPTRLSPLCSVDSCLSPWNLRVSNRPTLMFIAG